MPMDAYWTVFDPLIATIMTRLPTIAAAVLALLVGWVVARSIGRLVQGLVRRLTQNRTLQGITEIKDEFRIDQIVGRATYYLVMLFVLVLFFDILGFSAVMAPFLAMANDLAGAIPNLLKAAMILLAAWIIARLLSSIVTRLTANATVSSLLHRLGVVESGSDNAQLPKVAGNLVYYLILLLFLPAVLGALNLHGLQGPFEQAMTSIVGVLPNLLAAAITLGVGYVIARIVRGVATHFLSSIGVDALPAKVGLGKVFESNPLSAAIGTIAFVLILIPVAISSLEALGVTAISAPAVAMLSVVLAMVPNVAIALLLMVVGFALARWVGSLTASLLKGANISQFLVKYGLLRDEKSEPSVAHVVGSVVSGIIVLLILIEVFEILRLAALSDILRDILTYLPSLVIAIAILAVGWAVAQFVNKSLRNVLAQTSYPVWLGTVAQVAVLVLAGTMAMDELGVARSIVVNGFTILFGSLGLAAAISLGLGSRDAVQRWIDKRFE